MSDSDDDLGGTLGVRDGRGEVPRYCDKSLPPYSYVPRVTPHPVSDPRGHMHGQAHAIPAALDPNAWHASDTYRYGADLFNHGFYWEAHEAWESLWHAAGRRGPVAVWLKSLIKLAAGAVKLREGSAVGGQRHAQQALELLRELAGELPPSATSYCGVDFDRIDAIADELSAAVVESPDPARQLKNWIPLG